MAQSCRHSESEMSEKNRFHWKDSTVWRQSAYNTMWCLLGCSIGDMGAIWAFQVYAPGSPAWLVMPVAMVCGILTSIVLETVILLKQMSWDQALKTAVGMSLISMFAMELAMNAVDFFLVGRAELVWWVIPPMLLAGFFVSWPYNYWRLKRWGRACH